MNDEDIIRLYFERDENAITETSNKYGKYCYTIAENILHNHEDSEECVADTYQKTWEVIPPEKPNIFSAFLGRITRNLSINRYKKNAALKRGGDDFTVIFDELLDVVSGKNTPEEELLGKELIDEINKFLASLSRRNRIIFVRRYWYVDDIKSIAVRFNTSENNISSLLRRLRIKLRDYLNERGFDL